MVVEECCVVDKLWREGVQMLYAQGVFVVVRKAMLILFQLEGRWCCQSQWD